MARPLIPMWFARWTARHVRWDEAALVRWMAEAGPTLMASLVEGAENMGYTLVKLDPVTEPGERPIILRRVTAADMRGVDPNA